MRHTPKLKKCEGCPLVSILETAIKIKQANVKTTNREKMKALTKLERHHLN